MLDRYLPLAKLIHYFVPGLKLAPLPVHKKHVPASILEYGKSDPLLEVFKIPVHNVIVNAQAMKKLSE